MAAKGFNAPEVGVAYARARDLAKSLEDSSHLFTSLWGLWLFNQMQPRKGTARALSEELLALSTRNADSGHTLQARHASWTTNFFLGEFKYAREQTAWGAELYDAAEHRSHKFMYGGHDPGVCSRMFGALSALMMGFPDQALKIMQNGRDLSKTINHPLSLLLGETFLAMIHLLRGEPHEARPILERAIRLATEASIPRGMWANFLSGWTLSGIGRASNGLAQALQDFDVVAAAGQEAFRPFYTGVLAGMCRDAGRVDDGVVLVDKALGLVTTQDSQWCLAELNRIKGELIHARGEPSAASEACFETAVGIARNQRAMFWELRATLSLARLRQSQGRPAEACDLLAPVYGWFTEGFDSADLKEAKAMLDASAS